MGEENGSSPARKSAAEAKKPPPPPWEFAPAGGWKLLPAGNTAAELLTREFDPPRFAIDGLLPEGLTILGGRPKQGKSWLSLLVAWAVAGGYDLDGRGTSGGDVLVLALEDTARRLQKRLRTLLGALGWVVPPNLHLHTEWPKSHEGGLFYIAEWLKTHPAARLVVVDTLGRFRKPARGTGNNYDEDYQEVSNLKKLFDGFRVSGIAVHHTRKLKAEDPFDELSGTLGISGGADTLMILDRERSDKTARLFAVGRDLGDMTVPLTWDPAGCRWTLGPAVEGIEAAGRVGGKAEGRAEAARNWLRSFLQVYAFPAKEIDAAGVAAGHSRSAISDAKTELGKDGTGELWFQKDGLGAWWAGLGRPSGWKRRPLPGAIPDPEIPD